MLKTTRVSDLSGTDQNVEEVAFTLAGQSYTLDLTAQERATFLKAFEKYTAVATPDTAIPAQRAGKAKTEKTGPTQAQLMREWAKANNVALPAKGVVPKEVRDLYRAAMAKDAGSALKEQDTDDKQEGALSPAKATATTSTASKPSTTGKGDGTPAAAPTGKAK